MAMTPLKKAEIPGFRNQNSEEGTVGIIYSSSIYAGV